MTRAIAALLLALSLVVLNESAARAEPAATPTPSTSEPNAASFAGLQSPEQRSDRFSAYSLPKHMVSIEAGALGVSGQELYGRIGVAYGFGHGLQLDANLLHWSVGLFDLNLRWNFLDTPHFALAATVGGVYGHGAWMWILTPAAEKLVADSDFVAFPIGVTASAPLTRWLQLDLPIEYQYSTYFGSIGKSDSTFYTKAQIGVRQFMVRPTVRVFVSDATALELGVKLPLFTQVPVERDSTLSIGNQTQSSSNSRYADVKFKDTWSLEGGVRSRLQPWLFATVRLHYGRVAKALYGAPLYPSFGLEFRL
jgi:hypothetical protein